jgi:hypothetical protein
MDYHLILSKFEDLLISADLKAESIVPQTLRCFLRLKIAIGIHPNTFEFR